MDCQSRATVKLSSTFQDYIVYCEYGSNVLNKKEKESTAQQDFLLLVSSPKFVDGASVILIGKDSEDEALMLEVCEGDVRWTSFVLEEAVTFTVEFADASSSSQSPFFLCTKHEGIFKYICISVEKTLFLSATCADILSFGVIQLFGADTDIDTNADETGNKEQEQDKDENEKEEDIASPTSTVVSSSPSPEVTRDARSEAPFYHSGPLMKKGDDLLGSWKKRHFVALNAPDLFRIDYYDKQGKGGVKKGSIDLTGFQAMLSPPEEEKFGILLVPGEDSPHDGRNKNSNNSRSRSSSNSNSSNRSRSNSSRTSSGGRIYRLKAESASSQAEWLRVFVRACAESSFMPAVDEKQEEKEQEQEEPSPLLTAESLSSRSRSRTDSGGSGSGLLSISIPPEATPSRQTYLFIEGPLGMTLKRRSSGVIYIATVEDGTQAAKHLLTPGETLWSIGSKVVGGTVVDKEGWGQLVAYIKETPRPIEMVFQKLLPIGNGNGNGGKSSQQQQQQQQQSQEEQKQPEDCSSTKSTYSLVDYPTPNSSSGNMLAPRARPPSPSTPLSLLSVPSSSSGSHLSEGDGEGESESQYSRCNSGATLQSMETNTSSVVHVQPQQQEGEKTGEENKESTEEQEQDKEQDKEQDIERTIVEDLSKHLIFKHKTTDTGGTTSTTAAAGKSWRSSILGGSGGGGKGNQNKGKNKPTFQLAIEGRRLAFEGQLLLLGKRALWQVKIPKMLFLFNDLLLVAVPAPGGGGGGGEHPKYTVEQVLDLVTCKVNCRLSPTHELVDGQVEVTQQPLLWELLYPSGAGSGGGSGSMVFLCPSREMQQKWVQHLGHCICEHASVLNGSSALGVGWRHQYLLGTMHAAVMHRDQAQVVALLESFAAGGVEEEALEGADEEGYTPLHYACILRLTGIVRLLQESSADVTAQDRRGLTPLHWSALQLDAPSLERLCMNLMDVDLEDHKGRTPLYLACVEGRAANGRSDPVALLSCVTTLLTYGAHPDRQDREGLCVLHYLSAGWQYPVVDLLLDGFDNPLSAGQRTHCADVNLFDQGEGLTALHYACSANSLQRSVGEGHMILQSVLSDQQDSSSIAPGPGTNGSSANGAGLRTVLSLLEHGALPNMTTFCGHTPLSLLATATTPHSPHSPNDTTTTSTTERWATAYDSAIVMLLSHGARMSILSPSSHAVSTDIPDHWANPPVMAALEEGALTWSKKDQLDGDAAGLRLKCYEQRKCINAQVTSDLRALAARMSDSPHSSTSSVGGTGATPCLLCLTPFSMFRRQHHCRLCDALCCDECSRKRIVVDKSPVRVCDTCYCLAKRRVDTVLTEQFFAGQGAQQNNKTELFQGAQSQSPDSSSTTGGKTSASVNSTMATMEDTKLQLQERGEKLANLGDKSEKLANASNEFANMAKLLKEQNKSSSWW